MFFCIIISKQFCFLFKFFAESKFDVISGHFYHSLWVQSDKAGKIHKNLLQKERKSKLSERTVFRAAAAWEHLTVPLPDLCTLTVQFFLTCLYHKVQYHKENCKIIFGNNDKLSQQHSQNPIITLKSVQEVHMTQILFCTLVKHWLMQQVLFIIYHCWTERKKQLTASGCWPLANF